MTTYKVAIDVQFEFEIVSDSMEESLQKAKEFLAAMKPSSNWPNDLSYIDRTIVKKSVTIDNLNENTE